MDSARGTLKEDFVPLENYGKTDLFMVELLKYFALSLFYFYFLAKEKINSSINLLDKLPKKQYKCSL